MNNINLIHKVAWSFHRSTKYDLDELFQEAALAYYTALRHYNLQHNDMLRGRLNGVKTTTFLYRCMQQHLINYLRREKKKWNGNIVPLEQARGKVVENSQLFERLSRDAQEMLNIALLSPSTFSAMPREVVQRHLARIMISRGWSWKRVWCATRDISLALK